MHSAALYEPRHNAGSPTARHPKRVCERRSSIADYQEWCGTTQLETLFKKNIQENLEFDRIGSSFSDNVPHMLALGRRASAISKQWFVFRHGVQFEQSIAMGRWHAAGIHPGEECRPRQLWLRSQPLYRLFGFGEYAATKYWKLGQAVNMKQFNNFIRKASTHHPPRPPGNSSWP